MANSNTPAISTSLSVPGLLTGLLIAGVVAVTGAAYIVALGERARVEVQRETAAEISQENAAFCAKFGIGPGTRAFAACSDELAKVRQRQDERSFAQADLP